MKKSKILSLLLILLTVSLSFFGCGPAGPPEPTVVALSIPATFADSYTLLRDGKNTETLDVQIKLVGNAYEYVSMLKSQKKNANGQTVFDTVSSTVRMDKVTLMPLSTKTKVVFATDATQNWELSATYKGQDLSVFAKSAENETTTSRHASYVPFYDNETYTAVFRAFPLAKDFTAAVHLARTNGAQFQAVLLKVTGEETIKLNNNGEKKDVPCYRVVLTSYEAGAFPTVTLWFSKDENRYLIRAQQAAVDKQAAITFDRALPLPK